jgi:hypothetical protein
LVYRVKGIDLGLVGVDLRGLKDWKVYIFGVWRFIGRDTLVGLSQLEISSLPPPTSTTLLSLPQKHVYYLFDINTSPYFFFVSS